MGSTCSTCCTDGTADASDQPDDLGGPPIAAAEDREQDGGKIGAIHDPEAGRRLSLQQASLSNGMQGSLSLTQDDVEEELPSQLFQVRLGGDWGDLGAEELLQVRRGIAKGLSVIEITSRGQMYIIDLDAMTQTNKRSGKARQLREVYEDGREVVYHDLYIRPSDLGPELDPFAEAHPDWRWDNGAGTMKSYGPYNSMQLDRYWHVYNAQDGERYLAQLRLAKGEALVNFKDMTAQVGGGMPRRIERREQEVDWLNNRYFFTAFTRALERAGVKVENGPEEMFDFKFNQDFRGIQDDGRKLTRGGQEYQIPFGWKRFAVNVRGQYDKGDNAWLKDDATGWAVAYHGTEDKNLPGILATGFRVGPRQKFEQECGKGVYCTPDLELAGKYAKAELVEGRRVKVVLQMRVKPEAIKRVTQNTNWDYEKSYWVINDPADIRAYGVLVQGDEKK